MTIKIITLLIIILNALGVHLAHADTVDSRCDIYKGYSELAKKIIACTFSQRQGHITIRRSDGIEHQLFPYGDQPGVFHDQHQSLVYRQQGLGKFGQIFRFRGERVFVYWNTQALRPAANNQTLPFAIKDYDTTALIRCKVSGQTVISTCPAGIKRLKNQQAHLTVITPSGQRVILHVMNGAFYMLNHKVRPRRVERIWQLHIDNNDLYYVPNSLIAHTE